MPGSTENLPMKHTLHPTHVFRKAYVCFALFCSVAAVAYGQVSQGLVSCKPSSQKTGEFGCWIVASNPLGLLDGSVYWTLDTFPTRDAAERAKGPGGTVAEALSNIWVFTVGPKLRGTHVAQIGPLPVHAGERYTAQYMEGTLQPGMVSRTHVHSGVEAFYTESGETCLETPQGKQVGRKGVDIVVPEGAPMELVATGAEIRKGLMLVLHDASKPPTMPVENWQSKRLCGNSSATQGDRLR